MSIKSQFMYAVNQIWNSCEPHDTLNEHVKQIYWSKKGVIHYDFGFHSQRKKFKV